jgi:formate dehydrogenase maturation protein FdhE
VGTRDVITSILLTAGFIIIAQGVSHKSREGMKNKEKMENKEKKVDCPACSSEPPLFIT